MEILSTGFSSLSFEFVIARII